jgi:phosphatidate phosphatase PAH1
VVYGAYGNANTDTEAYMEVGIRPNLVYLVNKSGQLRRVSDGAITSYGEQAKDVNRLYPE